MPATHSISGRQQESQAMQRLARQGYPIAAGIFAAFVVLQVFLAGLGVFDRRAGFEGHRDFGYLLGMLTLVLVVVALVARMPRRIVGQAVLLLVLLALQSVFVALRADLPQVAALHPVNGFAILAVAAWTTREGWRARTVAASRRAPVPAGTPAEAL